MKKVFYLCGRAFALLILMQLSSCTDRNLEMKPEVATVSVPNGLMPTVSEGRLVFNSNQQFKAYMEMIAQKPIEEVIQMNKSIGFHSFFEKENDDAARRSGEGIEQEEEAKSIIPDSDFALVLNNNLEMELEHQKIYRLDRNGEYCGFYTKGKEVVVGDFARAYQGGQYKFSADRKKGIRISKDLTVFKTEVRYLDAKAVETPKTKSGRVSGIGNPDHQWTVLPDGTGRRRMGAQAWDASWVVYASSGCHTKHQRRSVWIWWDSDADNIEVSWSNVDATVETITPVWDPVINQYTTNPHIFIPSGTVTETGKTFAKKIFDRSFGIITYQCDGGSCGVNPALEQPDSFHINSLSTSHYCRDNGANAYGYYFWN